jgi:hypothetical protein
MIDIILKEDQKFLTKEFPNTYNMSIPKITRVLD